jgi:hypothetical protein
MAKPEKILTFSPANAKLRHLARVRSLKPFLRNDRKVFSFDLLSGYTCPHAKTCLAKVRVDPNTGTHTIEDGPEMLWRCFSASQEAVYKQTFAMRQRNFHAVRVYKDPTALADLIASQLPSNVGILRLHVAGDMFSQCYFDAWLEVAKRRPDVLIYAYTKAVPYWLAMRSTVRKRRNLVLTASYGGRYDHLITPRRLRSVKIVYTTATAKRLQLPIDHDDRHAADPTTRSQSFALLLHGVQPAGSPEAAAVKKLNGRGSYSRNA